MIYDVQKASFLKRISAFILDFIISAGIFPEYFSEEIISEGFVFKRIYFAVCGNNALI